MKITLNINGKNYSHDVEPRMLLIHYLREVVGLTGPHVGCETSLCGACTVEVNGQAVKSCTHVRRAGGRRARGDDRRAGRRRQAASRCRKRSGTNTDCSAGSARRG